MLSILIPAYNYDLTALVKDLHEQGEAGDVPFEIICLDDDSGPNFKAKNSVINGYESATYEELSRNVGRSKIRNLLAEKAKYEYLLFMDCDSKVVHQDYLKAYVDRLEPNTLLYGGRCYQKEAPAEANLMLHWKYGSEREAKSAAQRQLKPYHSFMTNNFLIPKKVFDAIKFDESLLQYGHEDTLFGLELLQRSIPIHHFDNPLEHTGLEKSVVFLNKTKQALENLDALYSKNKGIETRLLSYFNKMQGLGLHHLLGLFHLTGGKYIRNNLNSSNPSLFLFDLYKLIKLYQIKKGKS